MSAGAPTVPTDVAEIRHRGPDPNFPLVREAPAVSLTTPIARSASRPDASGEQVLDVADIQGNIVGGFLKDFQTLLFLRIDDPGLFKPWLAEFANLVATADEVIAFNRLFKETSDRRGYRGSVKASWINIAFSHAGLAKLTDDADAFHDPSFRSGMVGRSAALGDPTADDAEGNLKNWLVQDGDGGADVLVIVAADTLADLGSEVAQVEQSIFAAHVHGHALRCGASIVFKQEGRTQLGARVGHEHFGFQDGVSQPGLRGRISKNLYDVLTPRQNPDDEDQGKPGQDLLWPGEFVFGYYGQDPTDDKQKGIDSLTDGAGGSVAPLWAYNGAYLVFRRLRQDVFKFHSFLHDQAGLLSVTPDALGARLVGRWASGAPTMRAPDDDNPLLAGDDCANNHFEFQHAAEATTKPAADDQCSDTKYAQSPADLTGDRCPFSAHIRKSYPRDDVPLTTDEAQLDETTRRLREPDTQTHRLLRRGIPFGPSSRSTPAAPVDDKVDRGLLFMAYMTSITDQFEFIMRSWVNNADFKERGAGVDPILGQSQGPDGSRARTFSVRVGRNDHELTAPEDWVIPTGGGYFFSPSVSALTKILAKP
jgi:Dyp-type peroxidase family